MGECVFVVGFGGMLNGGFGGYLFCMFGGGWGGLMNFLEYVLFLYLLGFCCWWCLFCLGFGGGGGLYVRVGGCMVCM